MSPSANRLHINIPRRKGVCRINSNEYKAFQHEVTIYELTNRLDIFSARNELKGSSFQVHFDMYFTKEKIYCKDGRVKKFDHHNRIKALADALAKVLHIDDSLFFHVSCTKRIGEKNLVDITLDSF